MFIALILLVLVGIGCSAPPAPSTPAAAPVAAPAPVATDTTRADALLADLAKREADYKKAEADLAARERLKPMPTIAAPVDVPVAVAAVPSAALQTPTLVGAATIGEGRDEGWWKNEMRTAEVKLTDDARRLQESGTQRDMAQRQMGFAVKAGAVVFAQAQEAFNRASADVQRLEAEVRNDRAAVERVREDARRANVPPGWLRWP